MTSDIESSSRSTLRELYRWVVFLFAILFAGLYAWGTRYEYHRAFETDILVRVNRYTGATYRFAGDKWARATGTVTAIEQDREKSGKVRPSTPPEKPTPASSDKLITPEEIREMAEKLPPEPDSL